MILRFSFFLNSLTDRLTDLLADRLTNRPTKRPSDKQTGRERQTYIGSRRKTLSRQTVRKANNKPTYVTSKLTDAVLQTKIFKAKAWSTASYCNRYFQFSCCYKCQSGTV